MQADQHLHSRDLHHSRFLHNSSCALYQQRSLQSCHNSSHDVSVTDCFAKAGTRPPTATTKRRIPSGPYVWAVRMGLLFTWIARFFPALDMGADALYTFRALRLYQSLPVNASHLPEDPLFSLVTRISLSPSLSPNPHSIPNPCFSS